MNDRPEAVFCIPDISDWILRTGKKGISYVFHQTKFRFKIKQFFNEEIATETQTKNDKKKVKFYRVYFTDTPFAFIYHLWIFSFIWSFRYFTLQVFKFLLIRWDIL